MKILVTGATGNIGRMVVDHLLARGADDVRALTTNPARAQLPDGVEVAVGYLGRPETLPEAFAGVDRLYLAPVLETVTEVVRLAREAGVRQIVDLSGDEDTDWQPIARAVEASGLAWTHLYAGEFVENTTVWADQVRAAGDVREPYPDAANAPVAMGDIARVAAAVLLGDGHEGRVHTLTGPETMTRRGARPPPGCRARAGGDLHAGAAGRGRRSAGACDGRVRPLVPRGVRGDGRAPADRHDDDRGRDGGTGHDVRAVGCCERRRLPLTGSQADLSHATQVTRFSIRNRPDLRAMFFHAPRRRKRRERSTCPGGGMADALA